MKSNRNTTGVAWSAIERFAVQGSQFIISLILARMLAPSDYGVIAMLSIFIQLATSLIDSGMAQALIQRKSRSDADLTTALIFNVAVAMAMYIIIYLCAPYIAEFYNTPEICNVARIYSIVLLINSLSVVQQAIITIALDFKHQAIASLTGISIGGVAAVILAYRGWGVWALVIQQIISDMVRTIILWAIAKWRPSGGFSLESFKVLSRFGSKLMLSGILHVAYVNLYPLIIGRFFTSSSLGLFNRATTIGALPSTNISTIVDRALYPLLCERQESPESSIYSLHRYLRVVCFGVFPAMVGISILAEPITLLLLGDRWVGVAPLLSIISLAYMWDPIMKFSGSIIKSQGRSADFLRAELIKKISGVAILFASIPLGIEAMAIGLILYAFADMAIVIYFARRIDDRLGYRSTFYIILPTLLITCIMGVVVWATQQLLADQHYLYRLIVGVTAGAVSYLILAIALKRPEIEDIYTILKNYKTNNND